MAVLQGVPNPKDKKEAEALERARLAEEARVAAVAEAQRDAEDLPGADRFAVPGEHHWKRHDRRATLSVHRVRERREAFRRAFRHLRSRC